MRLITFQDIAGLGPRLGALVGPKYDWVVDLSLSKDLCQSLQSESAHVRGALLTGDMALLLAGDDALSGVSAIVQHVESMLDDTARRDLLLLNGQLKLVDTIRFLPTVHRPGKIVCVGLNFQSHIDEAIKAGAKLPQSI